jgi:hypothetical protein
MEKKIVLLGFVVVEVCRKQLEIVLDIYPVNIVPGKLKDG